MLEIRVPRRATVNESYQLAALCAEAEKAPLPVTIDCSETEPFGPLGVAMLASTFALRRSVHQPTELRLPNDPNALEFIREVGFDRFATGISTGLGTLEVRQMHALDAVYTQGVVELLAERVPGRINEDNGYPIQLCLNELLQNVFEWSKSPVGCIVLTRWFKRTQSVRLAVVDRGIGIPAALRRKKIQELHRYNDADVIEAAVTTPRLTSRNNQVGGLGLKTIREVVCGQEGRLTVVSLSAKLAWSHQGLSKYKASPFRGTAVEIEIRPDTTSIEGPECNIF